MSQLKRIERILEAIRQRTATEVGALIGSDFTLDPDENRLLRKEDFFEQLQGKQVCSQIDIAGDVTGKGCLLINIKDAILLGGTLIMLPGNELEEFVGREDYTEEIEDSYGEIANIIAGSFTKDFEEMYPKACRFIRKEQSVISPQKLDPADEKPVENQIYYTVSFSMALEGRALGSMIMLMPASTFDLEDEATVQETQTAADDSDPDITKEPKTAADAEDPVNQDSVEEGDTIPASDEDVEKSDVPVNREKHKEKFNRLLAECQERLEKEVGELLGTEIIMTDLENRLVSKEDFFIDHTIGQQIVTDMEVVGELEGMSYFVVEKKDAIHLGGILIMLPPSELESAVAEQDFGEDAKDAYGEIVNIASGVYTAVFEENYTKKVRFIKKELSEVSPGKVAVESDDPFEDQQYYLSTLTLGIESKILGKVHMLFPAELFWLESIETPAKDEKPVAAEPVPESKKPAQAEEPPQPVAAPPVSHAPEPVPDINLEKHKARVDNLLAECQKKMADEITTLIGVDIKLENLTNSVVTKEEYFFDKVSTNQVIVDMDVVGEQEGKSYLSVDLRDAIRIGGILIMLPGSELEAAVTDANLGDDTSDAYGEIANIIAGVYTAVFEEQYTRQIRFIKTVLNQVSPMKVEIDSADPIPNQHYYLSSMELEIDGQLYGRVNFLIPLHLLELQGLVGAIEDSEPVEEEEKAQETDTDAGNGDTPYDVLLIGDDEAEVAKISSALYGLGLSVKSLSFKDNVHNYIPGQLKAVYLVMKDVNEQIFGTAIKISSACSLPIIAAGPGWTRSKVIKAVKYGVADILLTPATDEDIKENVDNNLMKLAA